MGKTDDLAVLLGNRKPCSIKIRLGKNMSLKRRVVSLLDQPADIRQAIPEIDQQWRISIKEGTVLNQFGTGGLNDIRNGSVVLMSDLVLVDRTGLHYATCWINQTN